MSVDGSDYCGGFSTGTLETHSITIGGTPPPTGECAVDTVTMTTATWGNEVTWTLVDAGGNTACGGGPYPDNTVNTEACCVIADHPYTLNCIDSYGDGWHGGYMTIGD